MLGATPDYVPGPQRIFSAGMVIHIGTARCKKSKNERLVMKSFLNCVEKLPGGFEEGKVTDQWKL